MRANETFTKSQLFAILASKQAKILLNGLPYILSSIERESGSGHDFNLYVYGANSQLQSFYVRTAD